MTELTSGKGTTLSQPGGAGTPVAVDNDLSNPPKINLQITQLYSNSHTLTAAASDNLEAPVGAIPTSTAIGNALLNDFIPVENITGVGGDRIVQSGYDFEVEEDGQYLADGFGVFNHTSNNTVVGFTFSLERGGNWFFSPRVVRNTMSNGDRPTLLAGSGVLDLLDGDKVRIWLAGSNNGTCVVDTLSIRVRKLGDTL